VFLNSEPPAKKAAKKLSAKNARAEGDRQERSHSRLATPEEVEAGVQARIVARDLGPITTIGAHFIVGVEWLSAAIEGDEILVTGRFDGYIHRPEQTVEVNGVTATVRIPISNRWSTDASD
jgi:hypothetical protein